MESDHPQAMFKVDTVEEAIEGYEKHLRSELILGVTGLCQFMKELVERELEGKQTNLVCFCSPAKCHGEIVKKYVEEVAFTVRWREEICDDRAKIVGNIWKS